MTPHLALDGEDDEDDEEPKRLLHMLTLILPKCHRDTLEVLLVFLKRVSSFETIEDDIETQSYLFNFARAIGPGVLFSDHHLHISMTKYEGEWKMYHFAASAMAALLRNQDRFFTVPEEFLPLLHDQDFLASCMGLSSKELLKRCERYMQIKFGRPADGSVRGQTAERLRR